MRRLILHIGTEKTGTTTVQHFLHSNRYQLSKDGWTVPISLGEPSQRNLAVLCNDDSFVDAYIQRLGLADPRVRAKACAEWADAFAKEIESASTPNVVISSEHLSSRLFTQTEMDRLRSLLTSYFDDIDILVVLRDPLAAALSLVSTQVRTGFTSGSLPPPPTNWGVGNERSWISVCDHRQTIQRWEAAFPGRLNVRIFEPESLAGGSILTEFQAFLAIAGKQGYSEPERANESISAAGVALLAALYKLIPVFVDGRLSPYRKDLSEWGFRYVRSGAKLRASAAEREAYDTAFLESNEWVRANYFPDRQTLFTPDCWSDDKGLTSSVLSCIEIE